jgi:NAD-reducing hydrogenase large subunit
VAASIGTPLAEAEFKQFKQIGNGKPVEGSLYYHYARLIELVYALERVGQLLDDPDILSKDVRTYAPQLVGHGVGKGYLIETRSVSVRPPGLHTMRAEA